MIFCLFYWNSLICFAVNLIYLNGNFKNTICCRKRHYCGVIANGVGGTPAFFIAEVWHENFLSIWPEVVELAPHQTNSLLRKIQNELKDLLF